MTIQTDNLAKTIAMKFHAGQMYGEYPYWHHLLQVAESVKVENDDRLKAIAWLHDILEDTKCTKEILYALFEDNIVDAVIAISKVEGESKEDYIAKVKKNSLALTVKMHDTLCNLKESLIRRDMKRVKKYSNQLILLTE